MINIRKVFLVTLLALCAFGNAVAQNDEILLWPDGAPGALGNTPADKPSITPFATAVTNPTGAAIIVAPGGGYKYITDGRPVAAWLNSIGIKAFVLKYRLGPAYHNPAMMEDVQRAIRYVRAHATDYGIDPSRIGIMGFSAGGHIASIAGTHFTPGNPSAADEVERVSSRPDLMMLIYPVITMGEFTHPGSRQYLLGDAPAPDQVEIMSNEKHVTANTPAAFIVHGVNDKVVPVENSLMLVEALRKANVDFEMHIFSHAPPHGFSLGINDPVVGVWTKLCEQWLRTHQFVK